MIKLYYTIPLKYDLKVFSKYNVYQNQDTKNHM